MPIMLPDEFSRLLEQLDLSQLDLARLLSEAGDKPTAPTTINRYARGKSPIPGALALYLREAARVADLADAVGRLEQVCVEQRAQLAEAAEREQQRAAQVHNLTVELERVAAELHRQLEARGGPAPEAEP